MGSVQRSATKSSSGSGLVPYCELAGKAEHSTIGRCKGWSLIWTARFHRPQEEFLYF